VNSELPRSRQRFHCIGCSEDVCILCGRKRATADGTAQPVIPELSMAKEIPGANVQINQSSVVDGSFNNDEISRTHSLSG
jgi:hypothetical protein